MLNIDVEMVSDHSVRVSWDRVDLPEITGYTVYYSQTENTDIGKSITVSSSMNSVVIEDLVSDVEYQFQVAAIAELDEEVIVGQRSTLSAMSILTIPAVCIAKGKVCFPL